MLTVTIEIEITLKDIDFSWRKGINKVYRYFGYYVQKL